MSTFNKEQLIEHLRSRIEHRKGLIASMHIDRGYRDYLKLELLSSEIALASLEVEPVCVIDQSNLDYLKSGSDADVWPASRTEMGDVLLYRAAPPAPVVPENYVTAEHRRVIEMLLNVCGAAFELADDSCQQEVDGEECHVVPDDAFQKLSDALDEIENTLPTEDVDRPDVFLAWSAMPRAALKSILQAGKSPVTSDGWISCSERMPEDEQEVLTRNRMGHCFVSFFDEHSGLFFDRVDVAAACCIEHILVTHWMPLPAAPQQEVESQIRKGKTVAREEWELGARLTKHRFKP
ncbi:DUF551 domain-containing protein [Enterobacter hormaechei subsp. hoffmannii]|nr:DUF551 domain-containing protein [Enterobacter hormaechei subsp. hoffmannii]MCU3684754.1 DUF551 domain-containing protein [Enterobacter hormaechei subsp. hoffmannii]MCU3699054.1 DUF551 domain-containing protein [Enterobacter hormaechei subsp. hoffmannii]